MLDLVKRDVQQKYVSSYLGFVWVFLQPVLFVTILYYVFSIGLRVGNSGDMPFSIYLVAGMVVWLLFADGMNTGVSSVRSYAFLVKRVGMRLSLLPVVKLLSCLLTHTILLAVALAFAWYEGYRPSLYSIQLIYYAIAMSMLLLGISFFTSSVSLFIDDVRKSVTLVVQFGFWVTPVLWSASNLPESHQWIAAINPLTHIVDGYRESITSSGLIWDDPGELVYFWFICISCNVLGALTFRRLRPHFAEVL